MDTKKLRQKILDLAIHGKLVPQDPNDEPASVLLERIKAEKERLIKEGKIKGSKKSAKASDTPHYENVPFEVPEGWVWVTLGSISNYGTSINVQVEDIDCNEWVLELEDIEKDTAKVIQYLNKKERNINGIRHKFQKGDILYSKLRTYLNKVLVASNNGFCTTEIMPFGTYGILSNEYISLRIGTMTGGHNLPSPIRDPLMDMTPVVRSTPDNTLIAKGPEEYKYNEPFTHGYYEYGASFEWFKGGRGEVYMNWQIQHNAKHRERFDVGVTYAMDFVHDIATPYAAIHYWHNGGHEYPFVEGSPAITENYVGAIGINSYYLSILYMASYNLPDRDKEPGVFGHGLFLRGTIPVMTWFEIEPIIFVSGWYIDKRHKFISVEGDPFYRVPERVY